MEKKKLLLVAVSVGVVLLIILIIPLLVISPRKDFGASWQDQSAVIEPPNMTQGWESITEQENQPNEARSDEFAYIPANPQRAAEPSNVTTLSIPAPRSVAVPDAAPGPVQAARTRPTPVQPAVAEAPKEVRQAAPKPAAAKPAAVKPAVEKPAVAASAPAAAPAAVKPVAAKPVAEKPAPAAAKPAKTFDNSNFWIQTGAFSTMKHAEGAKDFLAERGITSIIENPVINGKTWYRVRVGPYTTRDEANYWLALVKAIDGFSASQVWETAAR